MDPTELIRIQRHVGQLLHPVLVRITQGSERPVDQHMLRALREFGVRCYLDGRVDAHTAPTAPPPSAAGEPYKGDR